LYTRDMLFAHMRFGRPENAREIRTMGVTYELAKQAETMPRSVHPAVWTRRTGEKVLHVSFLHSVGIEGHETSEGDALLQKVCKEFTGARGAFSNQWQPHQRLTWENGRMLPCVPGTDPKNRRCIQRTTIKGDYGLGYFEKVRPAAAN